MATMQALVLKAPHEVVVEQRPIPHVQAPTDCVCRVHLAALCGSDLHNYHGNPPIQRPFIMGHEFVGEVVETGSAVQRFKQGDLVVSPFTISCGDNCFYCKLGYTSRCAQSKLLGSNAIDGAQAEYIRIELADSTLFPAPTDVPPEALLLMADVLPTGYFVAKNAATMIGLDVAKQGVCFVIGCGPVGLCAITAATHFFAKVFAIDFVPARLEQAKLHGATPIMPNQNAKDVLAAVTDGRGPDAVLEVVGVPDAIKTALDLVRPWGAISSCGVHYDEIALPGNLLYGKNVRIQFGRCPVRALFPEAIELLKQHAKLFKSFISDDVPLERGPEYYKLFAERKVLKTVFRIPKLSS